MTNIKEQRFAKVRQHFEKDAIGDIERAVDEQLSSGRLEFAPGANIAIAAGSRGISNIHRIVSAVAAYVKSRGGQPFIVPAMGSHGGATADGQRMILATYGITEETVGCPIRSSMEVVEVPRGTVEMPLFMDRLAFESDGVILINRIKPHTAFHGDYESGLMKMIVIGLGKQRLASELHSYGIYGLKTIMPLAGKQIPRIGKDSSGYRDR